MYSFKQCVIFLFCPPCHLLVKVPNVSHHRMEDGMRVEECTKMT